MATNPAPRIHRMPIFVGLAAFALVTMGLMREGHDFLEAAVAAFGAGIAAGGIYLTGWYLIASPHD